MATLQQALKTAQQALSALPQANPELEAALLLCHLLEQPRSYLFAWPEKELTPAQQQRYMDLVERRRAQEPIAYITGQREFWSLNLRVNPHTLIPRPETELLVERSLYHLQLISQPRIADLGTGSGAIALALASERHDAQIAATDISAEALAQARENSTALGFTQLTFHQGSWCEALPAEASYDLIVSNPPYIEADDPHLNQGDLPQEPELALVSGRDGLDAIRAIIQQASLQRLSPGGWLLLEHGYQQAEAVQQLLESAGLGNIATHPDLAGLPRVTEAQSMDIAKGGHNWYLTLSHLIGKEPGIR
ncbi:MAG: protein-(glutamine-N5) methyltransferase, release factor-specific [gamma proteobacterium symbiont of Ctena orbiculata]|nr:MAG: protein-(glutamine-N5) methyltransferase, release factor-specific [gamma proteobacterium symbiont of Ctena orbiculata]PVV18830.1 MAG: protein-(glutamine-N5) methyltransferase, release factor-specific [gamma proteobacterium symbiont of Ctena orbiculata]